MKTLFVLILSVACGGLACTSGAGPSQSAEVPRSPVVADEAGESPVIEQMPSSTAHAAADPGCDEACTPPPRPRNVPRGETGILTGTIEGATVSRGSRCGIPAEGSLTVLGFVKGRMIVRFRPAAHARKKPGTPAECGAAECRAVPCPKDIPIFIEKMDYLARTSAPGTTAKKPAK